MPLILLSSEAALGGAGRFCLDVVAALDNLGWQATGYDVRPHVPFGQAADALTVQIKNSVERV
ncbi:MAG: hypothetical protein ABSG36_18570, partial [Acidimicrobiales bacterium]